MISLIEIALSTTRVSRITFLSLLCLLVPVNVISVQAVAKEPVQTSAKMIAHPTQKIAAALTTARGICDSWASEPDSQLTPQVIENLEDAFKWITIAQGDLSFVAGATETPMDTQMAAEFYAAATTIVAGFLQTELSSPSDTLNLRQQLLEVLENEEARELDDIRAIAYYRVATSYVALGDLKAALDYIRQSESIALTETFSRIHQDSYACH